jgi:hypothetical protein
MPTRDTLRPVYGYCTDNARAFRKGKRLKAPVDDTLKAARPAIRPPCSITASGARNSAACVSKDMQSRQDVVHLASFYRRVVRSFDAVPVELAVPGFRTIHLGGE